MLRNIRSRSFQERDRIGTAFGDGEVVLIQSRERSTIIYLLFLIWTGRYAQALNTQLLALSVQM